MNFSALKINKINYSKKAYRFLLFSYFNATEFPIFCTFYANGYVVSLHLHHFSNCIGNLREQYHIKYPQINAWPYWRGQWPHGPYAPFLFRSFLWGVWDGFFPFRIDQWPGQSACNFRCPRLSKWFIIRLHIV